MSVQVRRRREAASFLSTYVGAQGELLVDTTNNRVQVHDGTTPGGWPAARLADVVGRTAVSDTGYSAQASDRTIAFTSLTAARIVTLPTASAYPTGTQLLVVDESGACSATRTITVARTGTDTINGATSAVLALAYGYLALESSGAGKWTIVDQSTAGMAQQDPGAVAITGGSATVATLAATGSTTLASLTTTGTISASTAVSVSGSLNAFGSAAQVVVNDRSITGSGVFYRTGGISRLYDGGDVIQFSSTGISFLKPSGLPSFTVATLPAAGGAGRIVHCSNARVFNGAGVLEAAGAGTGGVVTDNGSAWKIAGTNVTVSA